MGTLASQAETGDWVSIGGTCTLAPTFGRAGDGCRRGLPSFAERVQGYHPRRNFEIIYAKSCNLVQFWPENGSQCHP